MVPRPSSPTSLLWAHQLKREHTHLLDRMTALENVENTYKSRLEAVEANNQALRNSSVEIAELSARIAATGADVKDVREWVESLNVDRQAIVKADEAEIMKLAKRVAMLEAERKAQEGERKKAFTKDKAVVKRVLELEAGRQKELELVHQLERKVDGLDWNMLQKKLDAIEASTANELLVTEALLGRLGALEASNQNLNAKTQLLENEIGLLKVDRVSCVQSGSIVKASPAHPLEGAVRAPPQRTISETTTEIEDHDKMESSTVDAPQSPELLDRPTRSVVTANSKRVAVGREMPSTGAPQLRRSARNVAVRLDHGSKGVELLQQVEPDPSPTPLTTRSLRHFERAVDGTANSGRKRKAAALNSKPSESGRQTRSQLAKIKMPISSKKENVQMPVTERKRIFPNLPRAPSQHKRKTQAIQQTTYSKESIEVPKPNIPRVEPQQAQQKRKRREIPQLYNLLPI
ncbi:hypothetical protein B0A49_06671 [Cryomyces minteri]|uniref:Uncharacterized protein n=1 Tax=Cryomyces minteri TaxID=331657 RepID=A0A4U0X6Y7_9PEZI|nr:hypothetical protein B0A49_06671 [Cryomyces minteri]